METLQDNKYFQGQVLAFDKPLRCTSFQLVGRVRWLLCRHLKVKKLKVGHAGTLDPLASGVLLLCTGKATKRIEELQAHEKEYVATLQLGATTPSYDLEHPIDATYPTEHITPALVDEVLRRFTGPQMQVPPAFSACKVDGHRAYDLARKGREVELQAKPIVIHALTLEQADWEKKSLTLRIRCSKGTYIRSLARDIGEALQTGAHLTYLRRTLVGEYTEAQCLTLEQFEDMLRAEVKEMQGTTE